jgi:hypothetical protein
MAFSSLRKVVHAAPEVTYGTAPAFAGAQAFVCEDFEVKPLEGGSTQRQPHGNDIGTRREKVQPRYAAVKFKIAPGRRAAAATAAPYRAALLAAGFAETITAGVSVTYSMVPGGFGSMAMLYNQDGQARTITGLRGGIGVAVSKQEVPYLMFEGVGLYGTRATAAAVAQTLTAWDEPDVVTNALTTFTLGGVSVALEKLDIKADNVFGYRNRPGQEAVIAERVRNSTASLSVLDEPRSAFDVEAWLRGETMQALDLQHGTGAGRQFRVLAPAAQVLTYGETDFEGEAGLDLELKLTSPLGSTADWSLVLS